MDAATLTFGIKDVIAIVVAVGSGLGFYYRMKATDEKHSAAIKTNALNLSTMKRDVDEKLLHAKNAKKANIQMLLEQIGKTNNALEKTETEIYVKMNENRAEQLAEHKELSHKIDAVNTSLQGMAITLSEITGYMKATQDKKTTK